MRRPRLKALPSLLSIVFAVLLAAPLAADWLVTTEGREIETEGPWTVSGETLTYVDSEGDEHSLPVADVDLEASEEMTEAKRPEITLYQTSWCGYCRRARALLTELGADFEVKDVEKDQRAAEEFRSKAQGYGGVPLIDFDGELLRGYSEQAIRDHVRRIEAAKADG